MKVSTTQDHGCHSEGNMSCAICWSFVKMETVGHTFPQASQTLLLMLRQHFVQ